MRTIIAGSRGVTDIEVVREAVAKCGWMPTVVISGTARGVDTLGEQWAVENNVPVEKYPADWNKFKRAAGFRRNEKMAKRAQALIAVWDGHSRGTRHMIDVARREGLIVFETHV